MIHGTVKVSYHGSVIKSLCFLRRSRFFSVRQENRLIPTTRTSQRFFNLLQIALSVLKTSLVVKANKLTRAVAVLEFLEDRVAGFYLVKTNSSPKGIYNISIINACALYNFLTAFGLNATSARATSRALFITDFTSRCLLAWFVSRSSSDLIHFVLLTAAKSTRRRFYNYGTLENQQPSKALFIVTPETSSQEQFHALQCSSTAYLHSSSHKPLFHANLVTLPMWRDPASHSVETPKTAIFHSMRRFSSAIFFSKIYTAVAWDASR